MTLALVTTINAYAQGRPFGPDTWKEEVLLHDGQKIIVQRSQTYGGRHEIGQSLPVKDHTITFSPPGSNKSITWTSEYGEDLGRTNFKLIALHTLRSTSYIVAVPNLCLAYNKWGRPNPPYVVFKYDDSGWKRIALEELPREFKTINLVINNQGEVETLKSAALVTAELVMKLNGELSQPEYRTILRGAAKGGITECEELVRYKCGWGSPGEFNQKYFERVCK